MADRTCSVAECERPARTRGWCNAHYMRWRRHGDPEAQVRAYVLGRTGCSVEGCERAHKAQGYCGTHYRRIRVTGEPGSADLLKKPLAKAATEKKCTACGEVKSLDEYHRVSRKSRYVARCKACRNEEIRLSQLRRRYGLSDDEYEAMRERQGGACDVCGDTHRLCVDHDHETGKVRAILCDRCNRALGVVDDNAGLLLALVAYLERHSTA